VILIVISIQCSYLACHNILEEGRNIHPVIIYNKFYLFIEFCSVFTIFNKIYEVHRKGQGNFYLVI